MASLDTKLLQKIRGIYNAKLFLTYADYLELGFAFSCECDMRGIQIEIVGSTDKRRYKLVPIQQDS